MEAEDGARGVTAAEAERPDLILMDIQLPIMDGYEATRRIKANPDLKAIPIIVVTSYALSGDEDKARAAGCDDYITKPYSPRAVAGKDQRALALIVAANSRCTILRVFSSSMTTRPIATFWSCDWGRKATSSCKLAMARRRLPSPAKSCPI